MDEAGQRAQEVERGAAQAIEETAAVAAEEGEVAVATEGVGGAFGYLGGLAEGAAISLGARNFRDGSRLQPGERLSLRNFNSKVPPPAR